MINPKYFNFSVTGLNEANALISPTKSQEMVNRNVRMSRQGFTLLQPISVKMYSGCSSAVLAILYSNYSKTKTKNFTQSVRYYIELFFIRLYSSEKYFAHSTLYCVVIISQIQVLLLFAQYKVGIVGPLADFLSRCSARIHRKRVLADEHKRQPGAPACSQLIPI